MTFQHAPDELDQLLAEWAASRRLSAAQLQTIRTEITATPQPERTLDADWLWSRLRRLTELVEHANAGALRHVPYTDDDDAQPMTLYLQLA